MISAVDTNLLLDLILPDLRYVQESEHRLQTAAHDGALIISELVYAELAPRFPGREDLDAFLSGVRIYLEPSTTAALFLAGTVWQAYLRRRRDSLECPQCGSAIDSRCPACGASIRPRQHLVTDFVIGAHALEQADGLLTRDRGYYRTYFPELKLS